VVERVRRSLVPLLLVISLLVILLYFVLPTSTLFGQRAASAEARAELTEIAEENAELHEQIALLKTGDEIERLARRDFNLVYPDEVSYAVLPAPPEAVRLPNTWPFNVVRDSLAN